MTAWFDRHRIHSSDHHTPAPRNHPSSTADPYPTCTSAITNNHDPPSQTTSTARSRPAKRLAPGLEPRLRRLEEQKHRRDAEAQRKCSIGRIPEEQLEELEKLQRHGAFEVHRRGKGWTGHAPRVQMPSGGVRLDGSGAVLTDNETSMFESDVSSIIDISDHFVASDTEDELQDRRKYILPHIGKTRLNLLTKEELSPGPRQVTARRETSSPTPGTPRTANSATNGSPGMMEFPSNWHARNGSVISLENGSDSDFTRPSLSRAGSVYTLGRASFTGQLAQLTSMRLPDADSLAKKISSMPTALEAAKALSDASEQIRRWISKSSDVLEGLNAEDDVEWAAAGGREGIEEVDEAINRFQKLVEIYIEAIEQLQVRDDILLLSAADLKGSVGQMEVIITSWKEIKDTLKEVKAQVEVAMEWEVLWNTKLGGIAQDMESLHRLVFEMEEQRHQGAESLLISRDPIDLTELETIVEEQPGRAKMPNGSRFIVQPFSTTSPVQNPPSNTPMDKEDSSLLALFAQMQPLRADLDFLPMKLSAWTARGGSIFPSACVDLEQRREQLEVQWTKLEADAESLRKELGEDRWVMVFRNAGKQALKMCESVTRSFSKLRDAVEANEAQFNFAALATKVENYEQKKRHYGPAIERVLAIIDKGVADRLTVNGEILRLQGDMKRMWSSLQSEMADMDAIVDGINYERQEKNLRDSVSTVISSERSIASSMMDTPGSSPASSVIGGSRKGSFGSRTPTPLNTIKTRSSSIQPRSRLPSASHSAGRKSLLPKASFSEHLAASAKSSPSSLSTPSKQPAWPSRPEPQLGNKPRWMPTGKPQTRDFRPLAAFEPSPYAKAPVTPKHNYLRSMTKPDGASTPAPSQTPGLRITSAPTPNLLSSLPRATSSMATSRKSSLPVPSATPSRNRTPALSAKSSAPTLRPGSRLASGRRSSMLPLPPVDGNEADNESPSHHKRPPSALAAPSARRSDVSSSSRPRSRLGESLGPGEKPKWRP